MGQAAAFESLRPKASLSLFDSAAIVAGSMIGSGIFIVAADIVRETGSPAGLLAGSAGRMDSQWLDDDGRCLSLW